ncbi:MULTISPECIES: hypothetical protein [unclassified Devosia]|uniref:hypothetical protein n=1 Tax=unclassified Devosia TaxID=196773 RepID=UPI0015FBE37F|nr:MULTISPECIES: hypothetical protein [unclassified Devosia]MBJ6987797.1 hypothetical protein [Devosia sp. MC521]MBK1796203.1 hypothetical protein [Devosia sp. WQ 349K1]QMW63707.1 hypothetical protein H4N61_05110 [Devosia sp. MC521]
MSDNTAKTQTAASWGGLARQVGAAAVLGAALTVLVAMPAEFGVDPTGFGKLTGILKLSQPQEIVVETKFSAPPDISKAEPIPFRQDEIEIPLGALGAGLGATEYKVTMEEGQTLVYSWTASTPVVVEFHGHTVTSDGSPEIVMDYIKGEMQEGHGALTAPLTGIHGWYFANPTFEDATITLKLSGYYLLEPGLIGIH